MPDTPSRNRSIGGADTTKLARTPHKNFEVESQDGHLERTGVLAFVCSVSVHCTSLSVTPESCSLVDSTSVGTEEQGERERGSRAFEDIQTSVTRVNVQ